MLATAQVTIANRPMTMQGLSGIKTAAKGQGRAVLDHSYFLGAIRSKCSELGTEISKMQTDLTKLERDEATFGAYEGKATALAKDIKIMQGELADINMMQDKLNTHVEVHEVIADQQSIKAANDRAQAGVDNIFSERRKAETQVKLLCGELNTERNWVQTLVAQMSGSQRSAYNQLQGDVDELMKELQAKQRQLDSFNERIGSMDAELMVLISM